MWAWIIPILVKLLIAFLEELISHWLPTKEFGKVYITSGYTLAKQRQVFLDNLWWRFWLGPKRVEYGAKLYDKVVEKFKVYELPMSWVGKYDAALAARQLCDGLTLSENEL